MILKLLIDENVRREVIDFLKQAGQDIKQLSAGISDAEIAQCAKVEHRIILTHDLDFSNILTYPPSEYSGIIVLRIFPPSASAIITSLENLFSTLTKPADFNGRLIILEPNGFRMRQME